MEVFEISNDKPFCGYHHIVDGVVFYVGIGSVERAFEKGLRSSKWKEIVSRHGGYEVNIVEWFSERIEATRWESTQISSLNPEANKNSSHGSEKTSIFSIRIPPDLIEAIDSLADNRSKWILEACRMRLDGPIVGKVPSQALWEICAGKRDEGRTDPMNDVKARPNEAAVPSDPKPCVECTNPMREVKGKWACADASCAMYGKEQKGKQ